MTMVTTRQNSVFETSQNEVLKCFHRTRKKLDNGEHYMDEIVRTLVDYDEQNYRLFANINLLRAD